MAEQEVNPQEQIDPKTVKRKKIRKFLLLFMALVAINAFVWGSLYFGIKNYEDAKNKITSSSSSLNQEEKTSAESTPFPFQEMTIPYLRSREYNSKLRELTQISSNNDYSTYLTSYDSDGLKINGLLTIPNEDPSTNAQGDGKKYPAIIFVHGYIPPQNYQTLTNYASYVDFLAKNGFVVFKIDLRGHGDSEGEPSGSYYSGDYIIDTLNARAALASSEFVNRDKIGLWGHSMAGNVIARALAAQPEIPAIAIWAGAVYTYTDFSEFSIEDNSYQPPPSDAPSRKRRNEMFEKYGQFDSASTFWKQVPMTNYLEGIQGAISINHAQDDGVVDISYSRNFNEILDKTDITHELNEYPSGGHNFTGAAFNEAMGKSVEFFNKYLK
ncbi:MAG: hypothetical protein A3A51_03175 [Candidatus Levybacteria bacterium RIFCSPLOWO2_01_FULL_39_10]|nr:MAG: hypothetical protein A3A51_03175 [Candidatus Levybacteria bacterium RIFCSPLOWO2_01_FULL_39_10]